MHQPTHKFLESCDVVFDEGGPIPCHERIILKPDNTPSLLNPIPPTTSPATTPTPSTTLTSIPSIPSTSFHPKRATHPPIPDVDLCYSISSYGHCANVANAEAPKPKIYDEAMASLNTGEWLAACEKKMHTWQNLDVYDIIPRLKGHRIVGSKWVFHIKHGPDGSVQKHKARIIT